MKELETERLWLRPWRIEDLEDFYTYCKEPDVGPWAGWKPHESREESREILSRWLQEDGDEVRLAIVDKFNGRVIGSLGLEEDGHRGCKSLGYVLGKPYWGRGYMTEAVHAAIDYGFREMKLRLLSVNHYPENLRSKRVIEKAGFVYEGTLRDAATIYNGELRDLCCYSLRAWEYWRMRAKEAGFFLELPEELPQEELEALQKEFVEVDKDVTPFVIDPKGLDYRRWLERNVAWRTVVPEGYAPSTLFILTSPQTGPAGALDLRHCLTPRLRAGGGHIGYGIRPCQRGNRYAPYMLALGLEKAKEMGIGQALVCCDEDNPASARTIEACGGVLASALDGLRQYWIALGA